MRIKFLINSISVFLLLSVLSSCSYFRVRNLRTNNSCHKSSVNYLINTKIDNWCSYFLTIFRQSSKLNFIKDNELILIDNIINNTNDSLNKENIIRGLIKALSNFVDKKQIISIKQLKLAYIGSEINSIPLSINRLVWLGNYLHSKYIMYTIISNNHNNFIDAKIQIFNTRTGEIVWSNNEF
ncbi:MAG: hypothetical protein N4Q03_00275 [Candidatus Lightella neohaematopini]|nr:hypothetical protein [Candidatus Lightella neohaematopini]